MLIDADLLERIKNNDPTLTALDLSYKKLDYYDIQQLVNALATNTTLTTLNVRGNEIRSEGAKALAANTTLTTLDVGFNQIGAEGAKALADNTTLTTLDVNGNKIGTEGANALVANSTLTTLNVWNNEIDAQKQQQLNQTIARNRQQIVRRRAQFIQVLIVLAHDKGNSKSQSLWSQLPQELMVHIISLMDFRPSESIGKHVQQIKACAEFIFNNVSAMKESLTESTKTQQDFTLVERIARGKSQFQFFPPRSQLTTGEESNERPSIIQKIV